MYLLRVIYRLPHNQVLALETGINSRRRRPGTSIIVNSSPRTATTDPVRSI